MAEKAFDYKRKYPDLYLPKDEPVYKETHLDRGNYQVGIIIAYWIAFSN